jgi:hypothetical protein
MTTPPFKERSAALTPATRAATGGPDVDPNTFDPMPSDFECMANGTKVGDSYVFNRRGHLDEAIAVANSVDGVRNSCAASFMREAGVCGVCLLEVR